MSEGFRKFSRKADGRDKLDDSYISEKKNTWRRVYEGDGVASDGSSPARNLSEELDRAYRLLGECIAYESTPQRPPEPEPAHERYYTPSPLGMHDTYRATYIEPVELIQRDQVRSEQTLHEDVSPTEPSEFSAGNYIQRARERAQLAESLASRNSLSREEPVGGEQYERNTGDIERYWEWGF